MEEQQPNLDEWRRLYDLAIQVKDLAPWNWMEETDLFAVEDPETGELDFVSVMGQAGEHFAVAAYRGVEGLQGFMTMQTASDDMPFEVFMTVPQVQVSFEDRNLLHADDRALIKELGLKFRGRNAWPYFRSYRPGFYPWFLDAAEVKVLSRALEQLLDVASRFEDDESVLYGDDELALLVRTARQTDGDTVWEDRYQRMEASQLKRVDYFIDEKLLDELQALPRQAMTVEIDLFMLPSAVREGQGRPYFPFQLLLVDGKIGLVLGFELMHVENRMEDLWTRVPEQVALKLAQLGFIPNVIKARKGLLSDLLQPLAGELGVTLKPSKRMRRLDEAQQAMLMMLR